MNVKKHTLLLSFFLPFSLLAQNAFQMQPCQVNQERRVGALDGYREGDVQCPCCCYYYYDVDMDESWFDKEVSWPSRREDSWYDQLTR